MEKACIHFDHIGQYKLLETLGKGATCITRVGYNSKAGDRVAIKLIDLSVNAARRKGMSLKAHREMTRKVYLIETGILSEIKHPNVLRLKFSEWDYKLKRQTGVVAPVAAIGLELAEHGELIEHIIAHGKFSEQGGRTIFHGLVKGLEAIHNAGIAHRDLKPENILLGRNYIVKIADFGYARYEPEDGMETPVGTLAYMAPEVKNRENYTKKADMWSLGVILFILVMGFPPYTSDASTKDKYWWNCLVINPNPKMFWKGQQQLSGMKLSNELMDLISKLLTPDPKHRFDTKEVQSHPWFKKPIHTQKQFQDVMIGRAMTQLAALLGKFTFEPDKISQNWKRGLADRKYRSISSLEQLETSQTKTPSQSVQFTLRNIETWASSTKATKIPAGYVGGILRIQLERIRPQRTCRALAKSLERMGAKVTSVELLPNLVLRCTTGKDCIVDIVVFSDGMKELERTHDENDSRERRVDSYDNKAYTIEDFVRMYGPMEGKHIYSEAKPAPKEGSVLIFQRLSGNFVHYKSFFGEIYKNLVVSGCIKSE
mmetsp:Transcript_22306/g.33235  ORF Transcript_22306/g.33235 Transcript_22306/m.33235 type:complete len:542 (+) Transcript_22306:73-1698(+)